MSFLPQRRKSPEEIAQLRDSLGVPASVPSVEKEPTPESPPALAADAFDLKLEDSSIDDFSFVPMVKVGASTVPPAGSQSQPFLTKLEALEDSPKMANGFALPEISAAPSTPETSTLFERATQFESPSPLEPAIKLVPQTPAPLPIAVVAPTPTDEAAPALAVKTQDHEAGEMKIPSHKHTPTEIERLRRQMAFTQVESVYNPRLQKAHPFLVVMGYIPVLAGAVLAYFYHQPMIVTAPFVGFSLLIALIILLRKPISRHHAGFIFAICFLAIAFGILHYFPQLQHAA
jgi:hypothetical protein